MPAWSDPSTPNYKTGHFIPQYSFPPPPHHIPASHLPTNIPTAVSTSSPFHPCTVSMTPTYLPYPGISSTPTGFPIHLTSTLPTPFSSPPLTPSPMSRAPPIPLVPSTNLSPRKRVAPIPSPIPQTFCAPSPRSATPAATTAKQSTTTPLSRLPFAERPPIYAFTPEDLEKVLYGCVQTEKEGLSCAISGLRLKGRLKFEK